LPITELRILKKKDYKAAIVQDPIPSLIDDVTVMKRMHQQQERVISST
jgi:hypothetical protein